jgi:hypothetical protein
VTNVTPINVISTVILVNAMRVRGDCGTTGRENPFYPFLSGGRNGRDQEALSRLRRQSSRVGPLVSRSRNRMASLSVPSGPAFIGGV